MKKSLKLIAFIVSVACVFTTCGCFAKDQETIPKDKTVVKVYFFKGGYGEKFLQDMKTAYEKYNKNAYISLKSYSSAQSSSIVSEIEAGTVNYDLYFLNSTGMGLAASGCLESLDDVYSAKATASNLTVEDKMLDYYQQYFNVADVSQVSGNYYAMPWSTGYCGLLYNKTTLDTLFGQNSYTVPRTTDELISFSDDIKSKGAYPFVWSTETEYWTFMFTIWWAQYEGFANFENYFTGHYFDEEGNKKVATNAETLKQQGRLESFKLIARLMEKQNGYSHEYCDSMSFAEAQLALFGRGYGEIDKKLCVFMSNGDWADAEMKSTAAKYQQEIRFMRAPVISALGTKLGITESKLIEVVDYVDAVLDGRTMDKPSVTSTAGYTQDQVISAVKEARCMVYDLGRHHNIVLPKNPRRSVAVSETAKDFLKFFASDFASQIYVEALEGLNLPYNYKITDMSKFSGFVKSMYESYPEPIPVSYYKTTPLTFAGNIYITPNYKLETTIFSSTKGWEELGLKMYNDTVTRYTVDRNWSDILRVSGLID